VKFATVVALAWICACAEKSYGPPPNYPEFVARETSAESEDAHSADPESDEPVATPDETDEPPDDSGEHDESEADDAIVEARPHPLDAKSDAEIARVVELDLASLGSISLGLPNAGLLLNGIAAAENDYIEPVSPSAAYTTEETLAYLNAALEVVHQEFPNTAKLKLGDISAEKGGPLRPHLSHQSGRDVDIGYFYLTGTRWYQRGTAKNLDLPRNWAFVRALIARTDVELLLIDHSIQALLREHALAIGEDRAWVDSIFRGGGGRRPIIRHARGHATHIHIRFFNPIAQETARRAHQALVSRGIVPPVQTFAHHRARRGDTLGKLSKRYGVPVPEIKRANGLKSSLIKEKRTYLIPLGRSRPAPLAKKLTFPARRPPPPRQKAATDTGMAENRPTPSMAPEASAR
jgi:hypothetical protein